MGWTGIYIALQRRTLPLRYHTACLPPLRMPRLPHTHAATHALPGEAHACTVTHTPRTMPCLPRGVPFLFLPPPPLPCPAATGRTLHSARAAYLPHLRTPSHTACLPALPAYYCPPLLHTLPAHTLLSRKTLPNASRAPHQRCVYIVFHRRAGAPTCSNAYCRHDTLALISAFCYRHRLSTSPLCTATSTRGRTSTYAARAFYRHIFTILVALGIFGGSLNIFCITAIVFRARLYSRRAMTLHRVTTRRARETTLARTLRRLPVTS